MEESRHGLVSSDHVDAGVMSVSCAVVGTHSLDDADVAVCINDSRQVGQILAHRGSPSLGLASQLFPGIQRGFSSGDFAPAPLTLSLSGYPSQGMWQIADRKS